MKRILLAEDDSFIADVYTIQFKKEGWQVDLANDGPMALAKIKNTSCDLVILDIMLPGLDGWQILRNIRQYAPTKNTKVIVISNINPSDYPTDAKDLGVIKFFLKVQTPVEEILKAAQKALQ